MVQSIWLDALVQAKRIGNLLNEVLDLSKQMAESIDRNDQVSLQMLVAMRQEPIGKLEFADRTLRELADGAADPERAARLNALLRGEPAVQSEEQMLADQIASNVRRLKQVIELDKVLSQKLAQEKSVYQQTHKN